MRGKGSVNGHEARLSQGARRAGSKMRAPCLHLVVLASAPFLALMVRRNKSPQVHIPVATCPFPLSPPPTSFPSAWEKENETLMVAWC